MGENDARGSDESEDSGPDAATATVATRLNTCPPVQKVSDLPKDVGEGTICYVQEKGTSYLFVDGSWSSGGTKGEG